MDIRSALTLGKAHGTGRIMSGRHDANENPLDFVPTAAHVECVDCHNPCLTRHEITPLSSPPLINGRLAEVTIAKTTDGAKTMATTEYEVCTKCHAENSFTPAAVPRLIQSSDENLRFAQENPSFHPVKVPGKAVNVPSLRSAIAGFVPFRSLSAQSLIYCTDCHNSNAASKVGGNGPSGPHGSLYPHQLMDRYEQDSYPLAYAESNYALCYRCHDQTVLLDPSRSSFPLHQSHLESHQVPCSVCHDPHGVPFALGATPQANSRLINFDRRFVTSGSFNGWTRSCTVSCHPTNPKTY
jgi:formate-dependent nitrite reductase cytochrome c552 subunit